AIGPPRRAIAPPRDAVGSPRRAIGSCHHTHDRSAGSNTPILAPVSATWSPPLNHLLLYFTVYRKARFQGWPAPTACHQRRHSGPAFIFDRHRRAGDPARRQPHHPSTVGW